MSSSLPADPSPAPLRAPLWRRVVRRLGKTFWITVALPTVLAALYYGLMASDIYISESRFVVRSPERAAPSGLGALLSSAGISRSHDDTYTVHGYIASRDALEVLDKRLQLRAAYSDPSIDVLRRFPGMTWWADSFEDFFAHYTNQVEIAYDPASSITTLQVRAFTPQMAHDINEALLQMSETLVNNLNDRSRQDLIQVAQREVKTAEARSTAAALALTAFRQKGGVFDPAREAGLQIDTAARLREDLRVTETQIAQLRQVAPGNPQIATLGAQAERLRRAIADETAKVVGQGNSINAKAAAYERLMLEKDFADKGLVSALATLEAARNDAARKQLYLERLVKPNLPDTPLEPRRWRAVLTVLVLGLVVWGVFSLLIAGVREHVD